jgi:hypothetical protein
MQQSDVFILLAVTCTSTVHTERIVAFQLHYGYADAPYCYVTCALLISSSALTSRTGNLILIYKTPVKCSTRLCSLKHTVLVLTGIIIIKDKFPHLISLKVPQTDVVRNTELSADMKLTSKCSLTGFNV